MLNKSSFYAEPARLGDSGGQQNQGFGVIYLDASAIDCPLVYEDALMQQYDKLNRTSPDIPLSGCWSA